MLDLKQNLRAKTTWLRGFFILVFAAIWAVAEIVLVLLVTFQFLTSLFAGKPNAQLLHFGKNLSRYIYEILLFLSYNVEEKPFPFRDWPSVQEGTQLHQS